MGNFGSRIIKPLVLAAATFWSVKHLGLGTKDAFLVALIPLTLGALSVYAAIGYALAVGSLLLAVASAVYPPIKNQVGQLIPQTAEERFTPAATLPENKD